MISNLKNDYLRRALVILLAPPVVLLMGFFGAIAGLCWMAARGASEALYAWYGSGR